MFRFLTTINSGVVGDVTSGDNTPGAVLGGLNIDGESVLLGVIISTIVYGSIWGIRKAIKYFKNLDNK